MNSSLFEKVHALLQDCGHAHEASKTSGVQMDDSDRAKWYAVWLLQHGLNSVLEQTYGIESLSASLLAIEEAYNPSDSGSWAAFCTAKLLQQSR